MSNYEDDQSEDGEIARSPVIDEMDFSLSDEDREPHDSLVIKPPQAVIRPSHRDKRGHKRSAKDRYKETARKDKKHMYRERDKTEKSKRDVTKPLDREEIPKEYYREKQYYREKETYREKEPREKETYRDREAREKEVYRENPYRERDHYRERELYRDTTSFREAARAREAYREKEAYRDKDTYREKEVYKEKETQRDREAYISRERQYKYSEAERKQPERIESRLRLIADEGRSNHSNHNNEKENRDKTSGDKELEDLRSRLLSKRISKELGQDSKKQHDYSEKEVKLERHATLDKTQQERRKKLLEAEREMVKRKTESRVELEARREERRRRGKRRSTTPDEVAIKKNKTNHSPNYGDSVVTVSDASDVDMKSESPKSEPEEGEHTNSETEDETSTDSDSEAESKTEEENDEEEKSPVKEKKDNVSEKDKSRASSRSKSPTPKLEHKSPLSLESRRSLSRSKSRSRSHSFSPPPPGENGKLTEEEKTNEDDEQSRLREEAINALPPYFPALQGCRSVEEFQCLNRIEEGTYGVVYRARDKTTEEIVALKRLKMEKEKEGFPITSLREINTLLKARHLFLQEGSKRCNPIARVNNFNTRAGLSIIIKGDLLQGQILQHLSLQQKLIPIEK